jgi:cytochrome c553
VTLTIGILIPPGVLCANAVSRGGWLAWLAWFGVALCVGATVAVVRVGWRRTGSHYTLTVTSLLYTDVALRQTRALERRIPLAALSLATVRQRGWQKALGIGDVCLYAYGTDERSKPVFRMTDVPEPAEVARLVRQRLYLLSESSSVEDDLEYRDILERLFRSPGTTFGRPPRFPLPPAEERILPLFGVPVFLTALVIGVVWVWEAHGNRPIAEPTYSAADPVRFPDGRKRPREEIVRFMRTEVLPFAKTYLAPVVGGADKVSCKTCHGNDPQARDFRMPAVAALPNTAIVGAMTRRSATETDVQLHNALVGELSDAGKAARAEYMRRVVLPKMAALLRRPTYDRLRTYEFNKERGAFGCYHCHELNKGQPAS